MRSSDFLRPPAPLVCASRRRSLRTLAGWAAAGAAPATALLGCGAHPPLLRVGTNRWAGYQFIHLAHDLGWLDPQRVRPIEMADTIDTLRALNAGTVEAAGLTLDELLSVRAEGLDLVAVLVFDESIGADALMAQPGTTSLAELRGQRVGMESSPVASLLLDAALREASLPPDAVQRVYLPAGQHLDAWRKNKVQAIVSYEPYVQQLAAQGGTRLFDSREMPGAIVDVLAVQRRVLSQNLPAVQALVAAHFKARAQFLQPPHQFDKLLAARLKLPLSQLAAAYRPLGLPDVTQNLAWLGGDTPRLRSTALALERSMRAAGLLHGPVPMAGLSSSSALPPPSSDSAP